jgi:hypothetical protein
MVRTITWETKKKGQRKAKERPKDEQLAKTKKGKELVPFVAKSYFTHNPSNDAPPSSLCDPKRVQRVGFVELVRNLVSLPTSSTKRVEGSCWKLWD